AGAGVLILQYNSLIDLYKNAHLYLVGFQKYGEGDHIYGSPILLTDQILTGSGYTVQSLKDIMAYQILGRIAHLLGDMAVPAHAHNDPHCPYVCGNGTGTDPYEAWEWDGIHYVEETAYTASQQGPLLDVYSVVPYAAIVNHDYARMMRYLFYTTNQMADRFPSNNQNGDLSYNLSYRGNDGIDDDYSVLSVIAQTNYSTDNNDMPKDPSQYDTWGREINKYAFRFAIRAIAGLYQWFAIETGMLNSNTILVENSFGHGTVTVDGSPLTSPVKLTYYTPNWQPSIYIEAVDQDYVDPSNQTNYHRVFQHWEELLNNGQPPITYSQRRWDFTVNGGAIYNAVFLKQFNVTLSTASFVESGSGGTYEKDGVNVGLSWSGIFTENVSSPITLEAVPPSGFNFLAWSDGNPNSSRTLIPTDHTTLYAIYKKHLASSISAALGNNAQRKLVRTNNGTLHMVYESGGASWYTTSTDNGATWSNESLVGNLPSGEQSSRSPVLVLTSDGATVDKIWDQLTSLGDGSWAHYLKWNGSDALFVTATYDLNFDPQPVAAMTKSFVPPTPPGGTAYPSLLTVVFRDPTAGGLSISLADPASSSWSAQPITGTSGATNAALAVATGGSTGSGAPAYQIFLTYELPGAGIKYLYGVAPASPWPPASSSVVWSQVYDVATNGTPAGATHMRPSIAVNGNSQVFIAWETWTNGTQAHVNVQSRPTTSPGSPDPTVSFADLAVNAGSPAFSPSLTDYRYSAGSAGNITLAWTTPNGVVAAQYDGSTWSTPYGIQLSGQGATVDLTFDGSTTERHIVYLSASGPPYAISTKAIPPILNQQSFVPMGWYMTSIPVALYNYASTAVYPSSVTTNTVWGFENTHYVARTTLANGAGYWVNFLNDFTLSYSGGELTSVQYAAGSGWNMIGSLSAPLSIGNVASNPPGIIISNFFGYEGAYTVATSLEPGKGYWVQTSAPGTLTLNAPPQSYTVNGSLAPGAPPGNGPASPTLLSPANGATSQPLTLNLSWTSDTTATQYRLQVSTNSSFGTLVVNDGGLHSATRQVGPLQASQQYFWRVDAANSGGTSAWSQVRSFTTTDPPSGAPLLASPANGAQGQPISPTLSWNSVTSAVNYRVQVSTSSSFSTLAFDDSIVTALSRQVGPLTTNVTYYWRVNARNTAGTSVWSTVWSFATTTPPPAPTLLSPANGATGQSTNPTLSWNAVSGATSYTVDVCIYSNFSAGVLTYSGITGTSQQVGPLGTLTTYYWRVAAVNTIGTGPYSSVWSFTTAPPPVPPTPTLSSLLMLQPVNLRSLLSGGTCRVTPHPTACRCQRPRASGRSSTTKEV
ncbi:MAG: hypothetical protein HY033_13410, partial [Ignavibacteriae bacterium]|nr:hypothetical protein [Ignavibacteriota bacterium]